MRDGFGLSGQLMNPLRGKNFLKLARRYSENYIHRTHYLDTMLKELKDCSKKKC